LSLEGIISKRADAPYSPGNRGLRQFQMGQEGHCQREGRLWFP
jgi:hypothetical protein